jgi:flagellar basal-body rod protein FlgB
MSKTNNIFDLIEAGIRAESLKQKAIANNVANMNTPGYRRIDVRFKELLADALKSSEDVDLEEVQAELYHPLNTPVSSNGNDVILESEVGDMVKNSLVHRAYVQLLGKKYKQMDLAINVG